MTTKTNWVCCIGGLLALMVVVFVFLLFAKASDPGFLHALTSAAALREGLDLSQEKKEQALYVAGIFGIPFLIFLGLKLRVLERLPQHITQRLMWFFQVVAGLWILINLIATFDRSTQNLYLLVGLVLAGLSYFGFSAIKDWVARHPYFFKTVFPVALAVLFAVNAFTPVLVKNIDFTHPLSGYHFNFVIAEFDAAINGRTFLVDFFPQYQNLLPTLMAPLLGITGNPFIVFTGMLFALTGIIFAVIYQVLFKITRSYWFSTVLFIPIVATAVFRIDMPPFEYHYHMFTYYMVGPLRYIGPFISLYFLGRYLTKTSMTNGIILFLIAGLSAINNLDFGVPALGAVLITLLMTRGDGVLPSVKSARNVLLQAGLGVILAIFFFTGITFIKSGQLPQFENLFMYQRIFLQDGFGMLNIPIMGFYWAFILTFLGAVGYAMVRLERLKNSDPVTQTRMAYLLFMGIFSAGVLMYYVGRSHPIVLLAIFLPWSLTIAMWVVELRQQWLAAETPWFSPANQLRLLPTLFIVACYLVMCVNIVFSTPNPFLEMHRLKQSNRVYKAWRNQSVAYIDKTLESDKHQPVGIIGPHAWKLTYNAKVKNVYPFASDMSVLNAEQMQCVTRTFQQNNVKHVFGPFDLRFEQAFTKVGFACAEVPSINRRPVNVPFMHCEHR